MREFRYWHFTDIGATAANETLMPCCGTGSDSDAWLCRLARLPRRSLGSLQHRYRWADGAYDRLPSLTNDLLSLRVNVIVPFGTSAIRAAKVVHATSSATEIPIVFAAGNDPVADGIVASLNRPGGNITGITSIASELGSKRLGLLREIAPRYTNNQSPGEH